ncbi:hypothetical protein FQN54_004854 [Arachnomyces sp. PD_36]|nr:hypothetical protein FQN54_004854 [Arachnomyces sp. PD_36]
MSSTTAPPFFTIADNIVLKNLLDDAGNGKKPNGTDKDSTRRVPKENGNNADSDASIKLLADLSDEKQKDFQPTVFTNWDVLDPQEEKKPQSDGFFTENILKPYTKWAQGIVRRPTDVVFLTHIIIYLLTLPPSVALLFYRFSWIHAFFHFCMVAYYTGPFTLMLHNHIHNDGVLKKKYAWFDKSFPYIIEPFLGHTIDSYFYHHVKHHHAEGNGPDDLSSTIRYQRDEINQFLHYLFRFLLFVWLELPLYFVRKRRINLAIRAFVSEVSCYTIIYFLYQMNPRATFVTLMYPLLQTRVAMMVGNWGQHAFVDDVEPDSNFRSSITVIDVASNRHCFNDGYHTSHHLNPLRHWRDHPLSLIHQKSQYANEGALVFQNIDYFLITLNLMRKNYKLLAERLVPMGEQVGMSNEQLQDLLRSKTRRFTEEDIDVKFGRKGANGVNGDAKKKA